MRRTDILLLFGTALCWGSSFLLIKVAVDELDPSVVMVVRCLLGAIPLWTVAAIRRRSATAAPLLPALRQQARSRPWALLLLGLLTGLPLLLVAAGEVYVDSGLAGIINASVPLWATLLAMRWDQGHATTPMRLVGVAIGFAGVVMLTAARGSIGGASEVGGILLVAAAGAMYASSAVLVRERLAELPSIETAAWSVTIGALAFVPVALVRRPDAWPSDRVVVAMLLLAGVGTFLGFLGYYELLARVGAARATMVTYLLPPLAVGWGALLLGERIGVWAIAAMLVIIAGVWVGSRGRAADSHEDATKPGQDPGHAVRPGDRPVLPAP